MIILTYTSSNNQFFRKIGLSSSQNSTHHQTQDLVCVGLNFPIIISATLLDKNSVLAVKLMAVWDFLALFPCLETPCGLTPEWIGIHFGWGVYNKFISKCPFGVKNSSKKPTKYLPYFCPSLFLKDRAEIGQKFRWFFGRSFDTKRTFWN